MSAASNFPILLSTNLVALLLCATMGLNGLWKWRSGDTEQKLLTFMFLASGACCIFDPMTFLSNGHAGRAAFLFNLLGNGLLYMGGVAGIWAWTLLLEHHLFGEIGRRFVLLAGAPFVACLVLIFVNFFYPLVFSIDENNIYHREGGLIFITVLECLYFFHSLARYYMAKRHGGLLKFFPVWNFVIPVFFGIIMQMSFFGTSYLPACCVVATTSVAVSFQNEMIYRDKLTGLYNRAYLDYITARLNRQGSAPLTGVMLDVNGFKGINDTYGHLTGDEALVTISRILETSVKEYGTAIRYAGDEFILLINSTDNTIANVCFDRMKEQCEAFNAASETYELSLSYGYEIFRPEYETLDDFMNRIDRKMYEDKERYYRQSGKDRRGSGKRAEDA